jgi:hypothetical protein
MLGLTFLRTFGLVRHWKQMWINHTFESSKGESMFIRRLLLVEKRKKRPKWRRKQKADDDATTTFEEEEGDPDVLTKQPTDEDQQLKNAATIGTALMLVNSQRALVILLLIVSVFPIFLSPVTRNPVTYNDVSLLQANNVAANSTDDCAYLKHAVVSWLLTVSDVDVLNNWHHDYGHELNVQWAQLLPVRCPWQRSDGVITACDENAHISDDFPACGIWEATMPDDPADATPDYFAKKLNLRPGELTEYVRQEVAISDFPQDVSTDFLEADEFYVRAIFNQASTVSYA